MPTITHGIYLYTRVSLKLMTY